MLVVAGLSLKNLQPRVWDPASPYHLPALRAVMISYADFHQRSAARTAAMEQGLHAYLGIPPTIDIYLDNGSFYFLKRGGDRPNDAYQAFVAGARPDWYPIPGDFIPTPSMTDEEQRACFTATMDINRSYDYDGYVPVIHISSYLQSYSAAIKESTALSAKTGLALGGIVPNLLRAPQAMPYPRILQALHDIRRTFAEKQLHVFGIGGTSTLHLAALIGMDSVDSSGWRNRAARGIIQLPGSGDRTIVKFGTWRGREPSAAELTRLKHCTCPACREHGLAGLRAGGLAGFSHRAAHNLWVLLAEAGALEARLADGSYGDWYEEHLDNSIYRPLITAALTVRAEIG